MPRITGEKILLREYSQKDLPSIREWVNDPQVVSTLSDYFLFPHTKEQTELWLKERLEKKNHDKAYFVIADRATDLYLGQIDLQTIDWKNRSARIGIVMGGSEARDKGYGTEALRCLIKYCFMEINLNRLDLLVRDDNNRAIRCYEKCGFKEEGRMRQTYYCNGNYRDHLIMSVLKQEWENEK